MGVARTLRVLNLYDVLVNLIPGATLLIALSAVIKLESYLQFTAGTTAVGIFLISSFVVGHAIQFAASHLAGTPSLFGEIVSASREGRTEGTPIMMTHVEAQLWPMMRRKFDLPEGYDNYGTMFRLLLSYVETTPATRAIRFQSLYSFHRSMWATSYVTVGVIIVSAGLKQLDILLVRSWAILGLASTLSVVGILVFDSRRKKFNKRFIQYAIADFYTDQIGKLGPKHQRAG